MNENCNEKCKSTRCVALELFSLIISVISLCYACQSNNIAQQANILAQENNQIARNYNSISIKIHNENLLREQQEKILYYVDNINISLDDLLTKNSNGKIISSQDFDRILSDIKSNKTYLETAIYKLPKIKDNYKDNSFIGFFNTEKTPVGILQKGIDELERNKENIINGYNKTNHIKNTCIVDIDNNHIIKDMMIVIKDIRFAIRKSTNQTKYYKPKYYKPRYSLGEFK